MKKTDEIRARLSAIESEMDALGKLCCESKNDPGKYEKYRKMWSELYDAFNSLDRSLRVERNREIAVGDGVTLLLYSDRHAYTVIKRTKTTITIQRDKATLSPDFDPVFVPGGFAGTVVNQCDQSYSYERDENGTIKTARWSEKRGEFTVSGIPVAVGRNEFYDYNF